MTKVVFMPSGLSKEVGEHANLLDSAFDAGVQIRSLCGGNGNCRQCWVRISEGSHPKHGIECSADSVSPITEIEDRMQRRLKRFSGMRLACRTHINEDVVIDVPESSQEHLTNINKSNAARDYSVQSPFQMVAVQLAEATMDDNPSASENLLARLAEQNIKAAVSFYLLPGLQKIIEQGKNSLDIALRYEPETDQHTVIAVYPKRAQQRDAEDATKQANRLIGVSVDIGSTTLAIYLFDLANGEPLYDTSAMNPQIRFGEDLMSRVSYVMMNKGGDADMTKAVRDKLTEMINAAFKEIGASREQLMEVVLVGNPIMHHLFFGIDPVPLGQAPFTVTNRDWLQVDAATLNLDLHPATRIAFLPLIAGHVGADTAAAYLSEIQTMQSQTALLVDIGTNAEIMLAKDGVVYATSSPTGPAFEGAEISAGMRAAHGAIERIRINPETLEVSYKIIGAEPWSDTSEFKEGGHRAIGICGSGIIEVMVELAQAGLIDKGGLFVQSRAPERFDTVDNTARFLLVDQGEHSLYVEQTDVRSIQLAKAALFAGVQLLMDYLDVTEFDTVLLAGAFGSHLDSDYVADLDLIPSATKGQIHSVGNAAGIGATKALLDVRERTRIIEEVRRVNKIESANEPKFQEYFVDGMKFSVSPVAGQQSQRNRRRRQRN